MTPNEIYSRLLATGIPVAYRAFESPQTPPYLIYLETSEDAFPADGMVYYAAHAYRIELYSKQRDMTAEAAVEAAFADVFYTKEQIFNDSEQVYETIYEMEV